MNGAGMIGIAAALAVAFVLTAGAAAGAAELSLIDDFYGETSAVGTRWEGFTDRVMGGVSVMDSGAERQGAESFLHLRGCRRLYRGGAAGARPGAELLRASAHHPHGVPLVVLRPGVPQFQQP